MLQTRSGKRTGAAMVRMAMEMLDEGLIDAPTAVLRVEPAKLDELLTRYSTRKPLKKANIIAKGLPASPGAATGQIVFFADEAEKNGLPPVKRPSSFVSKPLRRTSRA